MKYYEFADSEDRNKRTGAFLAIDDKTGKVYTLLSETGSYKNMPAILAILYEQGRRYLSSYWTNRAIAARVIPPERQNIRDILDIVGVQEYDATALLLFAEGRCCQDGDYLVPVKEEKLPDDIWMMLRKRIDKALVLSDNSLLVSFMDGSVKKYDANVKKDDRHFGPMLLSEDRFRQFFLDPNGFFICWNEYSEISCFEMYELGEPLPFSRKDIETLFSVNIVDTSLATQTLHCTRQNLSKKKSPAPVAKFGGTSIYLASDIKKSAGVPFR